MGEEPLVQERRSQHDQAVDAYRTAQTAPGRDGGDEENRCQNAQRRDPAPAHSFTGMVDTLVVDGLTAAVADNAGIFLFLVILGIVVALVNKAGASQAFGRWAETHVKTRVGAMLATFLLGVLIFIDDYFNCLTVGSVMSPVTDSH